MSQPPVDIIVVDDHLSVRTGLIKSLPMRGNIRIAAEACSGQEALLLAPQIPADLLLLDFSLPDFSGITLISRLKCTVPWLPILVLSMESDPDVLALAMDNGASGYVLKGTRMDTLVEGIMKVAAGGIFVDPSLGKWP
jgi:DNA-binding NarL/FixJ family response regulator